MRTVITSTSVKLWLSASDTEAWAHKPGAHWPCSTLAHRPLFAEFDSNGLLDLVLNYGRGSQDCDGGELSAMCSDCLVDRLPNTHPAYPVAVAQFQPTLP